MKFLCLVYGEEALIQDVADAECAAFGDTLQDEGKRIAAEALHPVSTARTVRVRDGKVALTDGPFAETKEQLAGFYLLDAENMAEAERIAAAIPPARVGSVEVRPVRELEP